MHLNFESIHFKYRIHWITNFLRSIHDNILLSTPPFYFYTPSWISWGQHDAHLHNKFYVKICDEKPHKSWPWFLLWAYIYIIYKFLDNVWENTNCVALLFRASRKTFPFSRLKRSSRQNIQIKYNICSQLIMAYASSVGIVLCIVTRKINYLALT